MDYSHLSPKELKDQELVNLHKDVLLNYIKEHTQFGLSKKNRVLALYDEEINRDNIRVYYNRHIKIFLVALILDQLPLIAKYQQAS